MTFLKTPQPTPFQLLEINVISAQDLAPVSRSMRTYAVAWVHPDRKLSTRVDTHGHADPTWNDKFVFRVDEEFLQSDTSAIMIEIYALRCFRDVRVGTVRVLVGNLIPPSVRPPNYLGLRFVALQVRRPSGRPQGILNIGVAILDSSMRSMPLYSHFDTSAVGYLNLMGFESHTPHHHHYPQLQPPKSQLRRTRSDLSELITDDMSQKLGSIINGSEIGAPPIKMITTNGSVYAESEVGPPPSVVAARMAEEYFPGAEVGSSILEDWSVDDASVDGLKTKLQRWRTELPPIYDRGYGMYRSRGRQARRPTDGEVTGGLFSCFGSTYGCECAISCGPGPRKKKAGKGEGGISPPESLMLT